MDEHFCRYYDIKILYAIHSLLPTVNVLGIIKKKKYMQNTVVVSLMRFILMYNSFSQQWWCSFSLCLLHLFFYIDQK
jgi:hypothetical protein